MTMIWRAPMVGRLSVRDPAASGPGVATGHLLLYSGPKPVIAV